MSNDILLVEDYADLRATISEMLARNSIGCDSVATAREAVESFGRQPYRLVIVDSASVPDLSFVPTDTKLVLLVDLDPNELSSEGEGCVVLRKPVDMRLLMTHMRGTAQA